MFRFDRKYLNQQNGTRNLFESILRNDFSTSTLQCTLVRFLPLFTRFGEFSTDESSCSLEIDLQYQSSKTTRRVSSVLPGKSPRLIKCSHRNSAFTFDRHRVRSKDHLMVSIENQQIRLCFVQKVRNLRAIKEDLASPFVSASYLSKGVESIDLMPILECDVLYQPIPK